MDNDIKNMTLNELKELYNKIDYKEKELAESLKEKHSDIDLAKLKFDLSKLMLQLAAIKLRIEEIKETEKFDSSLGCNDFFTVKQINDFVKEYEEQGQFTDDKEVAKCLKYLSNLNNKSFNGILATFKFKIKNSSTINNNIYLIQKPLSVDEIENKNKIIEAINDVAKCDMLLSNINKIILEKYKNITKNDLDEFYKMFIGNYNLFLSTKINFIDFEVSK